MLHSFHNVFLNGLLLIERRVLWQIAHGIARTPYYLALCGLFDAGDNLHQR